MSDHISREALKEAFDNADADVCESYSDGYCDWGFGRKNINDVIDGVPAADVEPVRRGNWNIRLADEITLLPGMLHLRAQGGQYRFAQPAGSRKIRRGLPEVSILPLRCKNGR